MTLVKTDISIEDWQKTYVKANRLNLSEFVRHALTAYIDSDAPESIQESKRIQEKIELKARLVAIEEIEKKKASAEELKSQECERQAWIVQNQQTVKLYIKGVISNVGWNRICAALNMNKKKAEAYIGQYIREHNLTLVDFEPN